MPQQRAQPLSLPDASLGILRGSRKTTRTPERARAPEPRAHRTKHANPSELRAGAKPPQRFSGRVHKTAARLGTHPAVELLLLLLGASAAAWEHLGVGAEEKAAERRARPKPGTAPPTPA